MPSPRRAQAEEFDEEPNGVVVVIDNECELLKVHGRQTTTANHTGRVRLEAAQ